MTGGAAPQEPAEIDRRRSEGNVFTNVKRRRDERPQSRRWTIFKAVIHGVAASILAAGTIGLSNSSTRNT